MLGLLFASILAIDVVAAAAFIFQHTTRYGASATTLNLVPLSDAWDHSAKDESSSTTSFESLLPNLGCKSFDSSVALLIPPQLSSAEDESITIINNDVPYRIYLTTNENDLPPIAQLTIDVFDATAITLSSSYTDWSKFEQVMVDTVVSPVIGMYNSYAMAVGFTEVLSGLRKRMRNRLFNGNGKEEDWLAPLVVPNDNNNASTTSSKDAASKTETSYEEIAARSSLILALARPTTDQNEEMEVVASVELRLQPTDAKIPFSQPWLDKLERRLVKSFPFATTNEDDNDIMSIQTNPPLRPYLCNLAVTPTLRGLGIGKALCRLVESIASQKWGYHHLYLHVDPNNIEAVTLYEKEGYVDVGKRWNVIWAGGAEVISYYVKNI